MKILAGILIGLVIAFAAEYLFLTQGGMPVSAREAKPLPLETFLTSRALRLATAHDAKLSPPFQADGANLLAAAKLYRNHCEVCHGAAGTTRRSPIALGMYPRPPALMPPGKGVTDDPVGETYWKVKNGIRLTGMPGFEGALTESELWQLSMLLHDADKLPGPVNAELR